MIRDIHWTGGNRKLSSDRLELEKELHARRSQKELLTISLELRPLARWDLWLQQHN